MKAKAKAKTRARARARRSDADWLSRLAARLGVPVESPPRDRGELVAKLRGMHRTTSGLFDDNALMMMEGALRIAELKIRDVMIPRSEWTAVREGDSYAAVVAAVREWQHSRYPVLDGDGEKVAGILLAKDLLNYAAAPESFSLREAMRPPIFEPLSKPLNFLLEEFRRRRNHMVVAVDEYAMPAGIVTIEDVLERIVGEIEDESDDVEEGKIFTVEDENSARVKGGATIEMFNQHFGANLEADGADTIAGWMAARLGHVPKPGETLREGDITYEAVEADRRAVRLLVARRAGKGRRGRQPGDDNGEGGRGAGP